MSETLLPSNEALELQQKDIAYRKAIPNYKDVIDFDPMSCDARLLPYLAQVWQVLYWDKEWSEIEKRRFVRDARDVHKHIGTPYALMKMFEAMDVVASTKEWYEYDGEPYHFRVDLSLETKEITIALATRLRKYIEVYKNVRTVLDDLQLSYELDGFGYIASGMVGEAEETLSVLDEYTHTLEGFGYVASSIAIEATVNLDFMEV